MTERERPRALDYALGLLLGLLLGGVGELMVARAQAKTAPGQVPVEILADDHLIYLGAIYGSFAREAAEGGGLSVHNHQTSTPHGDVLNRPWDWGVGQLGRLMGLGARGYFHLDRWLACLLFGPALVFVLGEFLGRRSARRWALFAIALGGSLYWLIELPFVGREAGVGVRTWLDAHHSAQSGLGYSPLALAIGAPHVLLELVFFACALGGLLRAARCASAAWALAAGLAILVQAWVRPYTVPVHFAVAAALWVPGLWKGPRAKSALLLALALGPCTPHLKHLFDVLRGATVFSRLDVVHPAPPLFEQLWFHGLLAFAAVFALVPAVWGKRKRLGLADPLAARALWVGLLANLALVNGEPLVRWGVEAMLPPALLFGLLAARAGEALEGRALQGVGALAVVLGLVPNALWLAELDRGLDREGGVLYVSSNEQAALDWLSEVRPERSLTSVTPPIALVCDPKLGVFVPWLGGVRTLMGHPDHTPRWRELEKLALRGYYRFGVGLPELVEAGATHILWGPRERRHRAPSWRGDPSEDERLELVWFQGAVQVYSILSAESEEDG